MPVKKFKGFNAKTYKTISLILFGIVIVETFFLIKIYSGEQTKKKPPAREGILTAKGKAKKKATKVAARIPRRRPRAILPAAKPIPARGKIAIIVDDSGYNIRDCNHLSQIDEPLTISILPGVDHSRDIARCAHTYQKEVMLHLPLEAYETLDRYPKDYIINTDMPKGLIIDRLEESLKTVPYADGINNHMGSKATENIRLMTILFSQLLGKNLFFVDSRVTSKTVGPKLAREKGLPFTQRDVFLDNVNERPDIEAQFRELARIAEENGSAIGIGHTRELTWKIIKEQLPKLTREGFEIVPVRTIANKKNK